MDALQQHQEVDTALRRVSCPMAWAFDKDEEKKILTTPLFSQIQDCAKRLHDWALVQSSEVPIPLTDRVRDATEIVGSILTLAKPPQRVRARVLELFSFSLFFASNGKIPTDALANRTGNHPRNGCQHGQCAPIAAAATAADVLGVAAAPRRPASDRA
jgi:hypothetical protein